MVRAIVTLILFATSALFSCKEGIEDKFPMEKRYWRTEDYDQAIRKIKYTTADGERFPEFSNPETQAVIKKLVDHDNFLVVLTDENLGLSHRNKVAGDFFTEYKDLVNAYNKTDRQDKFLYGMELIEILKFGLDLQLYYFKLGNDNIQKEADDPEAASVMRVIKSNEETVFKNFTVYLDFVNNESSFTEEQVKSFSEGINTYFPKLYKFFPNGDRKIIRNKAELMLKKAQDESLKQSLSSLLDITTD